MFRSRFILLGMLAAAMALMSLFASAAQAEGEWLTLTGAGSGLYTGAEIEANKEKFNASLENNTGALLSEIGTTKIDIVCTGVELIDALLNAVGRVKEGAKAKFTGCKFFSGGTSGLEKEQPKCAPKTNGGPTGTVETLPGHATLKLHELKSGEQDDTLLVLPDNEKNEEVVDLELGVSCAFGEELPIFGLLSLQDCGGTGKALEHLETHLLTEFGPLTTLALYAPRGKTGSKTASVDGSANVKLASTRFWSGDPAQGETEARWLVLKRVLYTGTEIEANKEQFEVVELENKTTALLSEFAGTKVDIVCTAFSLGDMLLNATGGIKEGATATFTGCKFFTGGSNGLEKEQPKCTPQQEGGAFGVIKTFPFHASLKLHKLANGELDDTLLVLPDNAEKGLIHFHLGAGGTCATEFEEVGVSVFGSLSIQDCGGIEKALEHSLTHLVTEFAPLTSLSMSLPLSKEHGPATVDGSANIKLNTGRLWAGSPQ